MKNLNAKDVLGFWKWFESRSRKIEAAWRASDSAWLDATLGPPVSALVEGASWEIGPGIAKPIAFAFSPNGSPKRLLLTERVASEAPGLAHWEFHGARPRKIWDFQVRMKLHNRIVGIDAGEWKYAMTAYKNQEFFDIRLFTGRSLGTLNDRACDQAAYIVIEGAIGEKMAIERIGRVETLPRPECDEDERRASGIAYLYRHLMSLVRDP